MSSWHWRPHLRGAAWLVVAALPPLLAVPQLGRWMFFDDAVYATVARELLRGGTLYVDLFDHKPPVIYLWYAAILVLGGGAEVLRLSLFLSLGATAVLVTLAARRLFGQGVAWFVGITFGLSTALVLISADGSVEQLMLLPMTASLLAYLHARDSGRLRTLVLAGALGGLAIWTKPLTAYNLIAIGLVAVAAPGALGGTRVVARLGALATGALAVSAVFVGFIASQGALPAAFDALIVFNLDYGRLVSASARLARTLEALPLALIGLGPLVPVAAWGVWSLRRRDRDRTLLLAWLAASAAGALTTGFAFGHYFIQLLPPLALLAGAAYLEIARSPARRRFLSIAALGVSAVAMSYPTAAALRDYSTAGPPGVERLYATMHDLGGPDRTLFVHGRLPQTYVISGMQPASRYFFHIVFIARPELWDVVVADLEAHPPDVIVEDHRPPGAFDRLSTTITSAAYETLLHSRYTLATDFGFVQVWKLEPGSNAAQ